jgi:lipopolysaccharide export system permease protein
MASNPALKWQGDAKMSTIGWLVSRMILVRFVTILLGISAFVVSLTLVTYSEEIMKQGGGGAMALAHYAALLLPVTASAFMAIAVLLGILLTLVELSYRSELTAIWATGLSPLKVVMLLLPMSLVIGGITFLIADQAVPRVSSKLIDWGVGEYSRKKAQVGQKGAIWLRAGNDILRASKANADASELSGIIIFRRDATGKLTEEIHASSARLTGRRWQLDDVIIYHAENVEPNRLSRMIYSGNMRPAREGKRSGKPAEMSTVDLGYFIRNAGFGIKPVHVFETWWHRRMSLLFTPWLMVALCIPLAVKFRRGGGAGRLFMVGLAVGFTFSIFEGISLTMGEVGFVPPWFGAWAPFLVYACVAGAMTFRAETVT